MNYNSEQPHSGPAIATTWPTGAVPSQPLPVEDHPDDSTHHHPLLPSSCISALHENERNTLASDKPVETDESRKMTPEMEYTEEFWLGLGWEERQNLVDAEKEAVSVKMRSKYNCGCDACHERWFVPSLAISGLEYAPNRETHSHIVNASFCFGVSRSYLGFHNPDPYLFHPSLVPVSFVQSL